MYRVKNVRVELGVRKEKNWSCIYFKKSKICNIIATNALGLDSALLKGTKKIHLCMTLTLS